MKSTPAPLPLKTTSTLVCKNCEQVITGHYCSNCGQPGNTHTINFHFLWHDIQHSLLHFDNGIFYTLKQLFTRPGHAVRDFIEGKRVRHFKPVSFVIVLATIYGLLHHSLHINEDLVKSITVADGTNSKEAARKLSDWIATHYAWVSLLTLPFYSLGSFLAFRKQKYNFMEHLVLNAYLNGQRLAVHILFQIPAFFIWRDSKSVTITATVFTMIDFLLGYWLFAQFFNRLSRVKTFFLTVLSHVIPIFIGIVLITVGAIIYVLGSKVL